tara:strand:+ start:2018 stop:2680 length:663 start_codon:yes stop_codon:yes gene_type:complete
MSSIPVVVLGIKRKQKRVKDTVNHLRKVGFKNVSIYYGYDIKGGNPEGLTTSNVIMYNQKKILEKALEKDTPGIILAEDDVRITKPDALFKHLKNGIKGVDRLVWTIIIPSGSNKGATGGNQMTGYSNRGMKNALAIKGMGHMDMFLSNRLEPKEKVSGPYGIEYLYPEMRSKKDKRGMIKGDLPAHTKSQFEAEQSRDYDEGNEPVLKTKTPIGHKRYQ